LKFVTYRHSVEIDGSEYEVEADWGVAGGVVLGPILNTMALMTERDFPYTNLHMEVRYWPTGIRLAALEAVCQHVAADSLVEQDLVDLAQEQETSDHYENVFNQHREARG
jgi:hypothetical protein